MIRAVTETFAVADQIAASDVAAIAGAGYRTLICNRPDGEAPGQPAAAVIAAEAKRHGLAFHDIPVISGRLTRENVDAFSEALKSTEMPVLAYCRSGTRSITLWSLTQTGTRPTDEIVRLAAAAGYDMSGVLR